MVSHGPEICVAVSKAPLLLQLTRVWPLVGGELVRREAAPRFTSEMKKAEDTAKAAAMKTREEIAVVMRDIRV